MRALEHALKMDDGHLEALALLGYARLCSMLTRRAPATRQAAIRAFANQSARDARPDLALVTDFLIAEGRLAPTTDSGYSAPISIGVRCTQRRILWRKEVRWG